MFSWYRLFGVAIIGIIIAVWQRQPSNEIPEAREYAKGRNNTALFIVNEHPGLSNVHAATAQSLLQFHPDVEIHFASFPRLEKTLARVSEFAKREAPQARDIIFHSLGGLSYYDAYVHHPHLYPDEDGKLGSIAPPGVEGIKALGRNIQIYMDPWKQEEHLAHFQQLTALIDEVDPAIVVLDTILPPAIEATRAKNRLHAFISPNMLVDTFPGKQPWMGMLWEYPA